MNRVLRLNILFVIITLIAVAKAYAGSQSPAVLDSLKTKFKTETDPAKKAKVYHDLSRALITSDLPAANNLALEGIEYCKKYKLDHNLCYTLQLCGGFLYLFG
ncbi:MAG: hypothetical protein R2809_11900 [Flavobacteriales bacterium]